MLPLISVIVPVYNVEAYLRECVDSIIHQTYTNLEIILINDGSPDNCGAICNKYSVKDKRIKVIHKENGGLSDARNVGIDASTGEYLTFIDSDDWIESDMIESLYNNLKDSNADISCCGFYQAFVNMNIPMNNNKGVLSFNREQAIEESLLSRDLNCFACGKLYKKSLFGAIRYPIGKLYEDVFVIIEILSIIEKIVIKTAPKYYYRQRKGSIVKGAYNAKIVHLVEAAEKNHQLLIERYKQGRLVEISEYRVILANVEVLKRIVFCAGFRQMPTFKLALAKVRSISCAVFNNKNFSTIDKISITSIRISIFFFKLIYIFNSRVVKRKHKHFV